MTNNVALRRRVVLTVGGILLGYLIYTAVLILIWRSRWQPAIDAVRRFNKKVGAGTRVVPPGKPATAETTRKRTTAVHHTGRTSGKRYVTPVWAERVGQSFFIQLPYGTDVDWCRNVLAGGGCTLEHHGVRYHATAPTIVPAAEARPHLPPFPRTMQRLVGARSYLRLDINPETAVSRYRMTRQAQFRT